MNKNYWPIGIFLLAMAVVGLIALTLKIAISNPIELQGVCGQNSQFIDENANEIAKMRNKLLLQYSFVFEGESVQNLKDFNRISLRVNNKENGESLKDIQVKFFLTRPNTTQEDKDLGHGEFVNGMWQSCAFEVEKLGRYQSEALVEIGRDSICITKEYFVR